MTNTAHNLRIRMARARAEQQKADHQHADGSAQTRAPEPEGHANDSGSRPRGKGRKHVKITVHRGDQAQQSAGAEELDPVAVEARAEHARFMSRLGMWIKIAVMLIVAAGITVAILHIRRNEELQRRKRVAAILDNVKKVDDVFNQIVAAGQNVLATASLAGPCSSQVKESVLVVLKEKLEDAPARMAADLLDTTAPPKPAESTNEPAGADASQEPQIKTLAMNVLEAAAELRSFAQTANIISETAGQARTKAMATKDVGTLSRCLAKLEADLATLDQVQSKAKEASTIAENAARDVLALRRAFEAEEKQRKERDEERQRQRDLRALAQKDADLADKSRREASALLAEDRCEDAVVMLKQKARQCGTDEGREKMAVLVDRYARIGRHKTLLAELINGDPIMWGWGHGAKARDVLGADDTGVNLRGGETVPWVKVDMTQMLRFVDHYMTGRKYDKEKLAELAFCTALYCTEMGSPEKGADYRDRAVVMAPKLTAESLRLLPQE